MQNISGLVEIFPLKLARERCAIQSAGMNDTDVIFNAKLSVCCNKENAFNFAKSLCIFPICDNPITLGIAAAITLKFAVYSLFGKNTIVLTLRFAVYSLFGKNTIKFGQTFLHPQKYALSYSNAEACYYILSSSINFYQAYQTSFFHSTTASIKL